MTTIKVGQRVRDRVTGFEGVVTGRCEYLTGCAQVLIQPPCKSDGAWVESHWFDETRLEITDAGSIQPAFVNTTPEQGADREAPRR